MSDPRLTPSEQTNAIKTWRYLRLGMVALVVGLVVSVLYETRRGELLGSISAYYYTPAEGYFVGALVAIGVCLFCLKGSTDWEDILLNLAGMLAPVVAFVPTPRDGVVSATANVDNNFTALLAVGVVGLIIMALVWLRDEDREPTNRAATIGFGLAVASLGAAAGAFYLDDNFTQYAHYAAAIPMFVFIFAVVVIHAVIFLVEPKSAHEVAGRWYVSIAAGMVVSALIALVLWIVEWGYWVLAIEGALIALFAAFWIVQTTEMWRDGLKPERAKEAFQELVSRRRGGDAAAAGGSRR